MKIKDLKELSVAELNNKLRETREELLSLRLRKQTGQVERPHELRELRKSIARIQTLIKEKAAQSVA